MKTPRALMFALICGFLAAIALYLYIDGRDKYWNDRYGNVSVLVARVDIEKYQMIDDSMLGSREIPRDFVEPDAISVKDKEKVIAYMADATIKKGSQITLTKLTSPGGSRVSILIPKNERACTISVNDITGVGGLIRPGDNVDILGAFKTVEEKSRLANQAEVVALFQNVKVLSVGRNYMFEAAPTAAGKDKSYASFNSGGTTFSNITVSMTPRACMDLTVAQQVGALTLMLRSYLNREGGETFAVLHDQHSTTASATGMKGPIEISKQPKWLELRGEHSTLVP